MSKKLMLMRHGDYNYPSLNKRGEQQADNVAEQMAAAGMIPDVIIHSPVTRAAETALRVSAIFNRAAGKAVPLVVNASLSDDCATQLEDVVDSLEAGMETALVVSHMPNISGLLEIMTGRYVSPGNCQTFVVESTEPAWRDFRGRLTSQLQPR